LKFRRALDQRNVQACGLVYKRTYGRGGGKELDKVRMTQGRRWTGWGKGIHKKGGGGGGALHGGRLFLKKGKLSPLKY